MVATDEEIRGIGGVTVRDRLWLSGSVFFAVVAAWFGFHVADGAGLATHSGTAVVIGKEYKAARTTYHSEVVGRETRVFSERIPEMYLVKLRIGGKEATYAAKRDLFNSVNKGDQVAVKYGQRRFTGGLEVIRVERRWN